VTGLNVVPPDDAWLPETCPPWCTANHRSAVEDDGLEPAQARTHISDDFGQTIGEVRNQHTGDVVREGQGWWRVEVLGEPSRKGWWESPPVMELETTRYDENHQLVDIRLHFLSGEARTMAAHLIRMADWLDFDCGLVE
jgi:hypothetical protein